MYVSFTYLLVVSGTRKTPRQKLDRGQIQPCFGAADRRLEVFGQPPVAAQPGECSLDYPAPGKQAKACGLIWPLHDGKRPLPHPSEGRFQLFASITAIGEDVAQPGEEVADRSQHADRAVPILDVGAVHLGADQQPGGVGDDVALAPVDLAGVPGVAALPRPRTGSPRGPPLSVVLTDWLSITPPEGL